MSKNARTGENGKNLANGVFDKNDGMAKSKLFESPAVWRFSPFSPLHAFLDINAGFGWSCDYL